jgi:hypothetical protein
MVFDFWSLKVRIYLVMSNFLFACYIGHMIFQEGLEDLFLRTCLMSQRHCLKRYFYRIKYYVGL